jgi:DNA-binding LytR/AlgR family response regulator
MKVLLIEDEINNSQWLKKQLEEADPQIEITATLETVEESIKYLEGNHLADLIFMDIKLTDGLCFEIFEQVKISVPVIFVTAYDEYVISALQYNCIDYLLKPIQPDKLRNAIQKYRQMETYFLNRNFKAFFDQLKSGMPKKIVVKRGFEFQTVAYADIAFFFVEQKIVFCVDNTNKKYTTEWSNLADVYEVIDKNNFFKANRKYIISAEYVKSFKHIDFGKTAVEMQIKTPEEIIISQENSQHFRTWIRNIK